MGIGHAVFDPVSWTFEGLMITGLTATALLGILIAWWREGLGGAVLVTVAVAHSTFAYFAAGRNKPLAMLISGGPFLVTGILFLVSWRRGMPRKQSGRSRPSTIRDG